MGEGMELNQEEEEQASFDEPFGHCSCWPQYRCCYCNKEPDQCQS